jgi:hypothetical protein
MLTIINDGDINMSGLNGVLDLKQTRVLQVLDARSGSHGVSRVLEPDPVNLSNYFYDRSKLSSQETKEVELYLAAKFEPRMNKQFPTKIPVSLGLEPLL